MKEITKYMAEDGEIFDNKTECEEYEKTLGAEYELTFRVNAIIRLDDVVIKRKIKTNAKPNYDYGSEFVDAALDAIYNIDNHETAEELLEIAANQNIYPYLDCFESEIFSAYKRIK